MNSNFFTKKSDKEGNVAIGKVPQEFIPLLNNIINEYSNEYGKENANNKFLTKHLWYDSMNENIKSNFNKIRNNEFWVNLCDGKKCNLKNIPELDELMYSYAPPGLDVYNSTILYGDTNAFNKHIDCDVCNFDGIKFYRVLIGLTDNEYVTTVFNNLDLEHKIQKDDYMIFDFGKTTHQVITDKKNSSPRLFMKMHFLINENPNHSEDYLLYVKNYHIIYYKATRDLQNETGGRNPSNPKDFFFGLMSHFYYNVYTKFFLFLFILIMSIISLKLKYIKYKFLFVSCSVFILYLLIVLFYYIRYITFGIR